MNNKLLVVTAVLLVATFAVTLSASFSDGDPVTGTDNEFTTKDEAKNIPGAIWTNNGHPMYVRETFDFTVDDIAYSIVDGGVEVSRWYWSWCPHTCDQGHTENVFSGSEYTGDTISIPATVTYNGQLYNVVGIGDAAFANASGYTVTFPNSEYFTYIGASVFRNTNPSMDSVTIPASVTHIGDYSFALNTDPVAGEESIDVVIPTNSKLEVIGDYAFANNSAVAELNFPDTLTTIGQFAFSKCTNLSSITIPASVTSLETATFDNYYDADANNGSGNVFFEEGSIFQIQNGVFYDNEWLIRVLDWQEEVVVPDGIKYIGADAFNAYSTKEPNEMQTLKSITLPDSLVSIGESAFLGCSGLESVVIEAEITELPYQIFSGCSSLTSITIPDSVTSIGSYAFNGCKLLADVVLPNSLKTLGQGSFQNCLSLTNLVIPEKVEQIPDLAFVGCISLESILLPEGLTTIGEYAFDLTVGNDDEGFINPNPSLEYINIPSTVTSLGSNFLGGLKADGGTMMVSQTSADIFTSNALSGITGSYNSPTLYYPEEYKDAYASVLESFNQTGNYGYDLSVVDTAVTMVEGSQKSLNMTATCPIGFELLTYSSSEVVATAAVEGSGVKITAVSAGTSTISIGIVHPETKLAIGYATVTVTVESEIATPTVTISGNHDAYIGQSVTLEADVSGTYASATYQWYNGGEPVTADGTNQTLTVTESGNYSVKVTVTTAAGQTASATSDTFTVTFHTWALPSSTMTLYPGFPAFYPLDYVASNLSIEFKDGSDTSIINIVNDSLIEYNAGYGQTTIVLESGELNPLELTINVLEEKSGITVSGSDVEPVVEVPGTTEEQNTRSDIQQQVSQDEDLSSTVPQSAISNGTIIDIKVPGEDGMPVQTSTTLTVPYSWFGTGISYANHSGFVLYAIHLGSSGVENLDVECLEDGVRITVHGFSPFLFSALTLEEATPGDTSNPGWSDDDELPPFIPQQSAENDDTTLYIACCAAAAVVALLAIIIVMNERKR